MTRPAAPAAIACGKLAAIRAVVGEALASEVADRQAALERVLQILNASPTRTGIEPGGSASVLAADVPTVLDALRVATWAYRAVTATCPDCDAHPADLCETCDKRLTSAAGYDALAEMLGGAR